jgi:hypothetical protein
MVPKFIPGKKAVPKMGTRRTNPEGMHPVPQYQAAQKMVARPPFWVIVPSIGRFKIMKYNKGPNNIKHNSKTLFSNPKKSLFLVKKLVFLSRL